MILIVIKSIEQQYLNTLKIKDLIKVPKRERADRMPGFIAYLMGDKPISQ